MFIMVKINISSLKNIKDDMEFASALVKEESIGSSYNFKGCLATNVFLKG
jgi:hypothetical protein